MHSINQIIDGGTPYSIFAAYIDAYRQYITHLKFGWGSSVIDPEIRLKIKLLSENQINYNPGGTLFEYFYKHLKIQEP